MSAVRRVEPNDWAAKRKAQIELAKQRKEERENQVTVDDCTFAPKINKTPSYLNINNKIVDTNYSAGDDPLEQPLPGKTSYNSETSKIPENNTHQPSQRRATSPTYKNIAFTPHSTSDNYDQYQKPETPKENADQIFLSLLRSDINRNSTTTYRNSGPGWNSDTADAIIPPLLNKTMNKASPRPRPSSDSTTAATNPNRQDNTPQPFKSAPSPRFTVAASHSQTHTFNDINLSSPSLANAQVQAQANPKSRLSLLKSKLRRPGLGGFANNDATTLSPPIKLYSAHASAYNSSLRRTSQTLLAAHESSNSGSIVLLESPNGVMKRSSSHNPSSTTQFGVANYSQQGNEPANTSVSERLQSNNMTNAPHTPSPPPNSSNYNPKYASPPSQFQTSTQSQSQPQKPSVRTHTSRQRNGTTSMATNDRTVNTHKPNTTYDCQNTPPETTDDYQGENEGPENVDDVDQKQCPDCGRRFNPIPYQKHVKICAKVFQNSRKVFDSAKMRINDNPELVKILTQKQREEKKLKNKTLQIEEQNRVNLSNDQKAKWKLDSEAFRNAMKAARQVSAAIASGSPLPPPVISAPDPSLVLCPHCQRRFSPTVAERHIPQCVNIRAKPSMLKRGAGGGGGVNGSLTATATQAGTGKSKGLVGAGKGARF